MTRCAGRALPASGNESEHDVISGRQAAYAGADLLYRPGPFVPADDGKRTREVAGDQVLVGVAHA